MEIWVGIDISAKFFDAAWVDQDGKHHLKVDNTPEEFHKLLEAVPAQFGESGQWIRSKAAGSPGSLSVSRGQGNQVAALVRIPPLLDRPVRAMECPLLMSLS